MPILLGKVTLPQPKKKYKPSLTKSKSLTLSNRFSEISTPFPPFFGGGAYHVIVSRKLTMKKTTVICEEEK